MDIPFTFSLANVWYIWSYMCIFYKILTGTWKVKRYQSGRTQHVEIKKDKLWSTICMFCRSLFVLLYFFLLTIVLSVLLRYTDYDCPFGIFKLFLQYITQKTKDRATQAPLKSVCTQGQAHVVLRLLQIYLC
jgi:hypothetical protein